LVQQLLCLLSVVTISLQFQDQLLLPLNMLGALGNVFLSLAEVAPDHFAVHCGDTTSTAGGNALHHGSIRIDIQSRKQDGKRYDQ
jgi:hypothetical protein